MMYEISGVRGHGRDLSQTYNVGRFSTGLEDVDGVVGVNVLHGNPIDHDNLVLGAARGGKHNCQMVRDDRSLMTSQSLLLNLQESSHCWAVRQHV